MKVFGIWLQDMASSLMGGAVMLAVLDGVISATAAKMQPMISLWRLGSFTSLSKGVTSSLLPERPHHFSRVEMSM